MEFFFPDDNLERTSPEETEIISLTAEPYQDGRRVRVNIEMSPFEKRPNLEAILTDSRGQIQPEDGDLTLETRLFYPDDGPEAPPKFVSFTLPEA
jgi:hypothetical protein